MAQKLFLPRSACKKAVSSYPRFLPSDVRIDGVPIFEGRADFQLPLSKRSSLCHSFSRGSVLQILLDFAYSSSNNHGLVENGYNYQEKLPLTWAN